MFSKEFTQFSENERLVLLCVFLSGCAILSALLLFLQTPLAEDTIGKLFEDIVLDGFVKNIIFDIPMKILDKIVK